MESLSVNKTFSGTITKYKTTSASLGNLPTQFNVFLPAQSSVAPVPVLFYLAGLTCNEDTGAWKGSFFETAAEQGIAIVFPDTSPRGAGIEGEEKDWDFGTGAGFYLNATSAAYKGHYNMANFITSELPSLLRGSSLPLDLTRTSLFGHSMGGHGALTLYLRSLSSSSPTQYRAASGFSPICNPTLAPWGTKAFEGYLEGGVQEGREWDATFLLGELCGGERVRIRVDVGTADNFYTAKQLLPENLVAASQKAKLSPDSSVKVNMHEGYDHSYYFISSLAREVILWHAGWLKA